MFDRILDIPLDHLDCFAVILGGIRRKVDICQTDYSIHSKQRIFPYSNVIHGSTTFKLTRVKEKQSTIKLDVLVLSFILFVPMYQTKSFINRSGTCYFLHTSS